MEEIRKNLSSADLKKIDTILKIRKMHHEGQITKEEAQKMFREEVGSMNPAEVAITEQELKEYENGVQGKEEIQSMLELFEDIIEKKQNNLPEDHPIARYYQENAEIRKVLLSIEDLVQYPVIRNQWFELYDKLIQFRKHLSRKQNQLYPVLEKKGFDRPSKVMWTLDDFIRDEISEAKRLIEEGNDEKFIEMQPVIVADVRDLMEKEEKVLYPTSLELISDKEFEYMKEGDAEIGYAIINVKPRDRRDEKSSEVAADTTGLASEVLAVLQKYGVAAGGDALLDVKTGKLTLEQINLIFRYLPIDISFVDENELVKFYSDTDHRIFPRSKNVIGRKVENCHPAKSVHLVREIVDKFRSGEQDKVDFWINKPDFFIYIYYAAVRDDNGKFRGVLEVMQDCTRIRSLVDSRTLLTWEAEGKSSESGSAGSSEQESRHEDVKGDCGCHHEEKHDCGCHHEEKHDCGCHHEDRHDVHFDETECGCDKKIAEIKAREGKDHDCGCHHEEKHSCGCSELSWINEETRLSELLEKYPWLKGELPKLHENFKMLSSPLARIMIPKANVRIMSERSGMALDELLHGLRRLIKEHKD